MRPAVLREVWNPSQMVRKHLMFPAQRCCTEEGPHFPFYTPINHSPCHSTGVGVYKTPISRYPSNSQTFCWDIKILWGCYWIICRTRLNVLVGGRRFISWTREQFKQKRVKGIKNTDKFKINSSSCKFTFNGDCSRYDFIAMYTIVEVC